MATFGVEFEVASLLDASTEAHFRTGSAAARSRILLGAHVRLRRRLAQVDGTVLVQRQVGLLPPLGLERRAAAGSRLVYDVDDAIWNASDPAAGGHRLAGLKRGAHRAAWLAERADQVVAGNAILAEWLAARTSAPVAIMPSLVDVDRIPQRQHDVADTLLLGWIGSSTTRPHLDRVAAALAAAAQAVPGVRLRLDIVGGGPMDIPGVEVRAIPWSVATEASLLAEMDIGLMPLPDTPWTRGKCAYKAQQYMAAGVPVVADDVGVSGQVIGDGGAGLLPSSDHAWTDALVTLISDVELRRRLGAEGRIRAERDFSVTTRAPELAKLILG
ncbi:MAG: glycosyltransferase [Solirubrobacteraceae bacterium]|nr:glycosyltransferase [Solirubrobacteraceae bacterium]